MTSWKQMTAEDRVAAIRAAILADPKQSDGKIADRFGVKRDVVSWHIRKYDIERLMTPMQKRRKRPARPRPAPVQHIIAKPEPLPHDPAFDPLPGTTPKTLTELAAIRHDGSSPQCHWPIGDSPILFCGCATRRGRYCPTHEKMSGKRVRFV